MKTTDSAAFDVRGQPQRVLQGKLFQPPVEVKLERGFQGLDVGEGVRVKLIHTDAERGFIDFVRD